MKVSDNIDYFWKVQPVHDSLQNIQTSFMGGGDKLAV